MDHDRPNNPYVVAIEYPCPDTIDDADIHSHLEGLETALSNLNSAHVPHLEIHCRLRKTASNVLRVLLQGSIFSHYLGELRKVSLYLEDELIGILSDEMLSTPTRFTLDGVTVALDAAQRAEWLLHSQMNSDRDHYLRGLLERTRVAAPKSHTGSPLAVYAPPGAEVGVGPQVQWGGWLR